MFVQRYRSICDSVELSFGACVGESTSTMLIHKGLLKYSNRRVFNECWNGSSIDNASIVSGIEFQRGL